MRKFVLFLLIMPGCAIGYLNAQYVSKEHPIKDTDSVQAVEQDFLSPDDGGVYTDGAIPSYQCIDTISPTIQIVNYGSNILSSAELEYYVDEGMVFQYNWSGSLEPSEAEILYLPPIGVSAGSHILNVEIIAANGSADIYGGNNNGSIDFYIVGTGINGSMLEAFDDGAMPEGYFVENPDLGYTWEIYDDGEVNGIQNPMLRMPFYHSYSPQKDELYIKNLNLGNCSNAMLSFDMAYVYYDENNYDQLKVSVSSDCGNGWDVMFDKQKEALSTTLVEDGQPYSDIEFVPVNPEQWRNESIDLYNYLGNTNVMIRFEGISGHGNNLYIDNIKVSSTVGIDQVDQAEEFLYLYPNPARDWIMIEWQGEHLRQPMISVINILGQHIYYSDSGIEFPIQVNTSEWVPGIYFINLFENSSLVTSKQVSIIGN